MCHGGEGGVSKQRMLLAVKAGLMQTTADHSLICACTHPASLHVSRPLLSPGIVVLNTFELRS